MRVATASAPLPGLPSTGVASARWKRVLHIALAALVVLLFSRNVSTYYFLSDDAFISFRYARNLVEGQGLVWNVGEQVEGYTCFLWVLLLAAGMRLGASPEILSNVLGIASGAALLATLVRFSSRRWGGNLWIWAPPLVLATSRTFTAWCTGGMETMFFAFLCLIAFDLYFEERRRSDALPWRSSLVFVLATLTRPEALLYTGLAAAFFLGDVLRGRRTRRHLLLWAGPWILVVAAHFLWRHSYYGHWLPNTFYAKVPGLLVQHGALFFGLFHRDYLFAWFLPFLALAPILRRDFEHLLLFTWVLAHAVYVLLVGGDIFEYRLLVFVFAPAYWLIVDGIRLVSETSRSARQIPEALRTAFVGAVLAALVLSTGLGLVRELPLAGHSHLTSVTELRASGARRIEEGKLLRKYIDEGLLPESLYVAMHAVGIVPYYTRWRTLDIHGLNDEVVARSPIRGEALGMQHWANVAYAVDRGVEAYFLWDRVLRRVPTAGSKNVRLGDRYLTFRCLVPEAQYLAKFGRLEEYDPSLKEPASE